MLISRRISMHLDAGRRTERKSREQYRDALGVVKLVERRPC